jgi:hypothetical protein
LGSQTFVPEPHLADIPQPRRGKMKVLLTVILWALLLAVCWPLALVVLVAWPILWLLFIPFRIVGVVMRAILAFATALLFLPARLLSSGARRA